MKPQENTIITHNQTTIGKYILWKLQSFGVEHIFGIPGDYILRFDKLVEECPISFVNTISEISAGYMADAYARTKGLGVACITYGVGITIANAVAQAYVESSPVIIISGAASREEYKKSHNLHHLINKSVGKHGDLTQLNIFKELTIAQLQFEDLSKAKKEIDEIIDECMKNKKPVYIELPRNLVDEPISLEDKMAVHFGNRKDIKSKNLFLALNEISKDLAEAKRPLIWIGHEVQRYHLEELVLDFIDKNKIPFVSSLLGKATISENHPLFVGVYQGQVSSDEINKFVESCDYLIMLGVILTDVETGNFTSDITKLENQVQLTAEKLRIGQMDFTEIDFVEFIEGLSKQELQLNYKEVELPPKRLKKDNFTPKDCKIMSSRVFECLQNHLTHEHILVADIGDCLFGSSELILEKHAFLSCAYFASLGFGLSGAIASQLASPRKRSIAIVGDGAFQMSAMELSTAVRCQIDPIVIIMNNHGYGTERPIIEGEYNNVVNWNYSEIPKVLGSGKGVRVETEAELDRALKEAVSTRGSIFIIEIELDKTDFSPPLTRFGRLLNKKT